MELPPELDPGKTKPDPETMRMTRQLEAALAVAAAPGGDPDTAFAIAEDMSARRVVASTPPRVVAAGLFQLTLRHLHIDLETPDPYSVLARRLVGAGRLEQLDLDLAAYGYVLTVGLDRGWLDAEMYDRLEQFGGPDRAVRILLARIERRATTPAP